MRRSSITLILKVLLVPFVLGLAACGPLQALGGNSQATPTTVVPVTGIQPSVTVKDQETDGTTIVVEDVVSQGPGWMVIHNQVNGNIGDPIGETAVNSGDNKNVVVNIDPTKATPVMYAMLHVDAGTVGKYEFPGPDIPVTINGAMVSPGFNATITTAVAPVTGEQPSVTVKDQETDGTTIIVEDVVSQGPGWMVIHNQVNGNIGDPIGETAVNSGDNKNVVVNIDPTKATPVMYAMLHVDAGTVGKYEFPGPDIPVTINGAMVSPGFNATITTAGTGTATPNAQVGGAATPITLKPSITVKDQEIQNGSVVIPQVVSNGNWWLVIHRQNADGSMGEYIGQKLIKNGINTDVVVKINMKLATPVLYAMLHEDNPPIGILEFPGSDVPVMENGQMIAPSFNVTGLNQDVTISIRKVSDTVSFLTDEAGNSLYISLRDTPGKSNCNADCQKVWRPLLAQGRILPGNGVVQANLSVITLADGTHQVTYLGAPLYTYSKDVNPGDTNGQGVDGEWFLVTP
jgi:predicted lipoprotein with Yx(FWY)xxD motif